MNMLNIQIRINQKSIVNNKMILNIMILRFKNIDKLINFQNNGLIKWSKIDSLENIFL